MDLSVKRFEMSRIYLISIIGLFFFILFEKQSFAQCDYNIQTEECLAKIQDGFIYVKSFPVDGRNGMKEKVEYSYVMTRDTQYYLNLCTPENDADGIIITIYDSERNPVSTNYADGRFFQALIYQCSATGIYYISYTFNGSKNYCAGSTLSFKK
jgi:hypothetical protein